GVAPSAQITPSATKVSAKPAFQATEFSRIQTQSVGGNAQVGNVIQTDNSAEKLPLSPIKLEKMPQALENRFALSAIPSHLRAGATTYVLDPARGYVLNHKGTNGISCIVVRSDWQWADSPFRDDIFWPVCYDLEGSKTLLQDYI